MTTHNPRVPHGFGVILSMGVLGLMLTFTYAFLNVSPYSGLYFNGTDGRVVDLYGETASRGLLKKGDILKSVGGVTLAEFHEDITVEFFEGVQPGETVEIVFERGENENTIQWVIPGYSPEQFAARLINPWWLGYLFWGFGLAAQLFMRPRDARWRLLIAMNETTGFWLVLGFASSVRVWNGAVWLHALTWISLPIYLHLHWIFPRPLKQIPSWGWPLLYLLCGGLALGEIFRVLSTNWFYLGVVFMFGGSILLLFLHLLHPSDRRSVGLLLLSFLVALLPTIGLGISGLGGTIPESGMLGILALPFMPAAYVFIIFRQRLGGLEVRASRVFSLYAYLILLVTILVLLFRSLPIAENSSRPPFLAIILVGLASAGISIAAFPSFQSFLDRRLLGITLPYENLLGDYSSRIATSASVAALLRLLEEDVFPSLLVKQYAFIKRTDDSQETLLVRGIDERELPSPQETLELTALAGRFLPPGQGQPRPWLRLILDLKAGAATLGFFLLGRRDPDDLYYAAEIPIFQSLADQTAVAMSNLLQTERLRSLYQTDIDRREQERQRLARELHDSVLNQLAALRLNVGEAEPSPQFQQAYGQVVQRLREIVSDLRPPLLNYGLKLALEELSQDLMERGGNKSLVTLAMFGDEERYSPNVELHLFRIAQEACENALRHAKAANVIVSAQLDAEGVRLDIQDDGEGFEMGERLELDDLLIHKHFGLAGIVERANLIGAQAVVQSAPERGTRIQIVWRTPADGQG